MCMNVLVTSYTLYFVRDDKNKDVQSLPKVIKKMKSSPPNHFFMKNFTMYRKMQERFWGSHISKPFPKTKTKIRRLIKELNPEL